MVTIYHNTNFIDFRYMFGTPEEMKAGIAALKPEELVKVAEVETDDLDVAYRQTNHIDTAWYENADVVAYNRDARSTSVGDVLELNGERYVVAVAGFLKI